jgi:hypothetical protein
VHLACDNDIFPPRFGGTQRLFGLARGLATRAEVRALCVVPNRSTGATNETAGGVAIHRTRAWYTSLAWWLERGHVAPLFTADLGHRAQVGALRRALGPGRRAHVRSRDDGHAVGRDRRAARVSRAERRGGALA